MADNGSGDVSETGETGDPSPDDPCDALIDCVELADPDSLSAIAETYGDGGTCYSTPGMTVQDCWSECKAQEKQFAEQHSAVAECGPPNCGNEKLDADEACDGTTGCAAACIFSTGSRANECNPVNNAPCTGRCRLSTELSNSGNYRWFVCGPNPADPSVELGGDCSNAACMDETALCFEGTCLQSCYLGATDENYGCSVGTCVAVPTLQQDYMWSPGSEYIGLCM